MRVASWIFVVCAAVSAAGVFLPSVELHAGSISLGKRASLSLYQANTNREFIRKVFTSYHTSSHRKLGEAILAAMLPKLGGSLKSHVDDIHSALTNADDVTDDDIKTATIALAITIWAFLALQAVMAGLIVRELLRSAFRRRWLVIALAMSVVVAIVAVVTHVVIREAVWEANDDIGRDLVAISFGAYMMLVAALAAVGAIGFAVVQCYRGGAKPVAVPAA